MRKGARKETCHPVTSSCNSLPPPSLLSRTQSSRSPSLPPLLSSTLLTAGLRMLSEIETASDIVLANCSLRVATTPAMACNKSLRGARAGDEEDELRVGIDGPRREESWEEESWGEEGKGESRHE